MVSAEEITYQNVITDDTTIEEDFKVLGMDIDNYYMPSSYDYAKWYVVAMSESYIDNTTIQTYFYIYNPKKCSGIEINTLYYTLNNVSNNQKINAVFNFNEHGLYKVKGFSYAYTEKANIKISKIDGAYIPNKSKVQPMAVLPPLGTEKLELSSTSDFEALVSHSAQDNTMSVELNYNSLIIIDEYVSVCVPIGPEDNFINNWESFWNSSDVELRVFFYNFNFPTLYQNTNEIIKTVFSYDKIEYKKVYERPNPFYFDYPNLKIDERVETFEEQTYNNETKTLQVNGNSQELNFPVFYLGNRIKNNQFGYFEIADEDKGKFDYDCSVLLAAEWQRTYINQWNSNQKIIEGTALENIEMIELHFVCDGIVYHSQVVNKPSNPIVISPEKGLWQRFIDWFISEFPVSLGICIFCFLICVAFIITIIFKPTFIFDLVDAVGKFIYFFIYAIFWVITFPFRLIFGKKKNKG